MPGSIGVLVIHGMGAQKRHFSDGLREAVVTRLATQAGRVMWQEVYWADALEAREAELLDAMHEARDASGARIPLGWESLRQFVMHNFGDALAYHRDRKTGTVYDVVQRRISDGIAALSAALNDPSAPVVILAHSLGVQMMSDYLWDRQHSRVRGDTPLLGVPTLATIVSFGCNVPLFALECEVAVPIYLPGEGIAAPAVRNAARWLNILDRDDVLGWPLRPLYARHLPQLDARQQETVARIEDREMNVGGIVSSWNPASHGDYWTDRGFTKEVASALLALLAAMDAP